MRFRVEVRCSLPWPEAKRVTIQVSSPWYWWPWYVSNRQIHDDLGVRLFAEHIRTLTASFDSKVADTGNPLVRQLGRYLRWPRVVPVAWRESQGRQGPENQSRPSPAMVKSTKWIAFGADQPCAFGYPDWGFPWFSSVVRQMPGYTMQSRGTARTPLPKARRLHLNAWKKSQTCSLRSGQSGLRTQTTNQGKFTPPIITTVPPRR